MTFEITSEQFTLHPVLFSVFAHGLKKEGNRVIDVEHEYFITTPKGKFRITSGEQFRIEDGWLIKVERPII